MIHYELLDYFSHYLLPPGFEEDFIEVKLKYFSGIPLSDADIGTVVTTSSYYAAVLRTAYKHFVKERDTAPRDYWDTVVNVFLYSGIWSKEWRTLLNSRKGTKLVKNTLLPQWTPIGLCGTNWSTLQKMLEFWCARFYPELMAI